jgi:hypothetical protein
MSAPLSKELRKKYNVRLITEGSRSRIDPNP